MEELLVKMVEKIDISTLPSIVVWIAFLYFVVVKDVDKRLSGLSTYIRRFLAIQQRQAKATEKLASVISALIIDEK